MTLGEKIRLCRKRCSLSQEQLAEKMCVSRSAIAKWETDKGLPDIENLKVLSRLLGVSVDILLDDSKEIDSSVTRESYLLANYGRGCNKVKKDRFIRERFPNARISALLAHRIVTPGDAVSETDSSAFEMHGSCRSAARVASGSGESNYYLIQLDGMQLFATVTDTQLEYRSLEPQIDAAEFSLFGFRFIRFAELD